MVKLRLNPPGYRRNQELNARDQAAQHLLLLRSAGHPSDIPSRDATAMNQDVAKIGPSRKRKATDRAAPAATQSPPKKAKSAASAKGLSAAVSNEEVQPRADSYSSGFKRRPGFERRFSPVYEPVQKRKRRGRSRTPCPATAAGFSIYIDVDALQQSNQGQASVNEAAIPAYSIAAAQNRESNAIGVAEREGNTVSPSLDKENVGARNPDRKTKKANEGGPEETKNLDSPKQGTKRSAEAESDDDEGSLLSQPPAKKQRLRLIVRGPNGEIVAPVEHPGPNKIDEQDVAGGEEPVVENTQGTESTVNAEEKRKPTSEENETKGEIVAESVKFYTRTDGRPMLTWRVTSPSTPPPYVGPPVTETQLEQAGKTEQEDPIDPIEDQAIVQYHTDGDTIDPVKYWTSRLMRYHKFASGDIASMQPENRSSSSDGTVPSSGSSHTTGSTSPMSNPPNGFNRAVGGLHCTVFSDELVNRVI